MTKEHHVPVPHLPEAVREFGWDAQAAVPGLIIHPYEPYDSEASGHHVMRGRIIGPDGERDVCVKPHPKRGTAAHELASNQQFAELGLNVPSDMTLHEGGLAAYLVADRYRGLTTLADICWRATIADVVTRKTLLPSLAQASKELAEVHSVDATHGDFQPKNVAHGPDGEAVYIDLERSTVHGGGRGGPIERANDLHMLGSTALDKGFLYDKSPSFRSGALEEFVISPHQEVLAEGIEVDYDLARRAFRIAATTGNVSKITRVAPG